MFRHLHRMTHPLSYISVIEPYLVTPAQKDISMWNASAMRQLCLVTCFIATGVTWYLHYEHLHEVIFPSQTPAPRKTAQGDTYAAAEKLWRRFSNCYHRLSQFLLLRNFGQSAPHDNHGILFGAIIIDHQHCEAWSTTTKQWFHKDEDFLELAKQGQKILTFPPPKLQQYLLFKYSRKGLQCECSRYVPHSNVPGNKCT